MQHLLKTTGLFLLIISINLSCKKGTLPVITTADVTGSATTALSGGNVTDDGGADISVRGVCWAKLEDPTLADSKTTDGSGAGSFTSLLTGLESGTKYYVRAYATNSAGTSYGKCVFFTTFDVQDIDENGYNTVQIGNQVWMAQNLKVKHFQNGDIILNASSVGQWSSVTGPAYCYYNNDISLASVYGNLYNNYTAVDSRNVCPIGWHVPSIDEWNTMFSFLGNEFIADVKMRETGIAHWIKDTGADNSSGFTFLPSGDREADGKFYNLTTRGDIWTSTLKIENNDVGGWLIGISWDHSQVSSCPYNRLYGVSIRCVKD